MFTGIIEEVGVLLAVTESPETRQFEVSSKFSSELKAGDSVAHNGICLTVVETNRDRYWVQVVAESLSCTNAKFWEKGVKINLERSLSINSRLDGHFVQGHVDTVGEVEHIDTVSDGLVILIRFPKDFSALLIRKGSVAVNGVSLTVAGLEESAFKVAIIPHTLKHTNFDGLKVGSIVNLEFDVIGKYVKRALEVVDGEQERLN